MPNNLEIIEIGNSKTTNCLIVQKYQRCLEVRLGSVVGTLTLDQAENLLRALEIGLDELHEHDTLTEPPKDWARHVAELEKED